MTILTAIAVALIPAAVLVQPWKSIKRERIALGLLIVACCLVLAQYPEPRG